jgi:hypothetical protein
MKSRLISYAVAAVAMVAVLALWLVSMPAARGQAPAAQAGRGRGPADTTPVPRMTDGHPDFSGFYHGGTSGISEADEGEQVTTKTVNGSIFFDYGGANNGGNDTIAPGQPPPYKPEYMAKQNAIAATVYGWVSHLDPVMDCKPQGVPRVGLGSAMQIVENPRYMAVMYEDAPGPVYRIIYTDGRQHPDDLDTSYMGNSVGHWEGDALVVDTIGLNDETWLGMPSTATIHSDKLHVIEKWTRPTGKTISLETTAEDPVMFTKPWVMPVRRTVAGPADDYIMPQACNTNDKAHIIEPSDKDRFLCNWCQKQPDSVYGDGAAKSSPPAVKTGRGAGGGGGY